MEKKYNSSLVELVFLGLTPALSATLTFKASIVMALAMLFILFMSTLTMFLLKKVVTDENKLFVTLVVTAFYSSVAAMVSEALAMDAFNVMGLYISLCAINTMIYSFSSNAIDGEKGIVSKAIIFALVYGLVICVVGLIREGIGNGVILGNPTIFANHKATILQKAPGAFMVASIVLALVAFIEKKTKKESK